MFSDVRKRAKKAGQPPGTATYTGKHTNQKSNITVITYDQNDCQIVTEEKLSACLAKQKALAYTWVNVQGLHDAAAIEELAKKYQLHPLTIEDILNVEQRPKVEEFDHYLFITLKSLNWDTKSATFNIQQSSIVLGKNFVLSFEETNNPLFTMLQTRMQSTPNQRLRLQGSDYLAYRIIDAIIDQYFVVLESLGEEIENIEQRVVNAPNPQNARIIYKLKSQMLILRKSIWPMREAISHLLYAEDQLITKFTRVYLRDVYDHTMQAIDTIETFRDMLSGMLDMYLSGLTIRMNEIMKTLTIITTIFIPITALASIYGMNLPEIPLMKSNWGFTIVSCAMITIAALMMIYFRRKKWI